MKSYSYVFAVILSIAFVSCQKEDAQLAPIPGADIKISLPKQFISIDSTNSPAITLIGSIKYDTANRRIECYADDTTNSNPYDELVGTYNYNNSGYLISHETFYQGNVMEKSTINRDADNKINWIAHEQKAFKKVDTSYFTYEAFFGGTRITTIVNTHYPMLPVFVDTYIYTYDLEKKLTEVLHNSGTVTYEYNVNKSLKRISGDFGGLKNETKFFYTSGIPAGKEDIVLKTFLGKDCWIQNIKDLYFLSSFHEDRYFIVSSTDAYYPTRMQDITNNNGVITTEERTTMYELNDRKLLYKVRRSLDGQHETTLMFKY